MGVRIQPDDRAFVVGYGNCVEIRLGKEPPEMKTTSVQRVKEEPVQVVTGYDYYGYPLYGSKMKKVKHTLSCTIFDGGRVARSLPAKRFQGLTGISILKNRMVEITIPQLREIMEQTKEEEGWRDE